MAQERADNSLTLILTSQPDRRLLNAAPLNPASIDEINATIERLECGDGIAQLDAALQGTRRLPRRRSRRISIASSMSSPICGGRLESAASRGTIEAAAMKALHAVLQARLQGCYVIDAGTTKTAI